MMIKMLRVERLGQTQNVFSEAIGISQTYLSLLEKSKKIPSTQLLEKIGTYVDVPVAILFWFSITENDIKDKKKEYFNSLKPSVDALIESFL